jgi:ABC-type amino acid transport substrate-binding protein
MSLNRWGGIIIGVLIGVQGIQAVDAARPETKLKVGISPFSPFVILDGAGPTGAAIDFWHELALKINVDYEFVECTGVADKLIRLEDGRIDVAIGGITVTSDRESRIDFSHPLINTGLDILIPISDSHSLISFISSLFTKNKLIIMAGVLLLLVCAGHVIWLVERSSKRTATMFNRNYFPGVLEGIYWALVTASTVGYGDKVPKRWVGRILAGILILIFLPIFGYFIAQMSSDLTVRSLKYDISGPEDLVGRRVAVVKGTTSEDFMKQQRSYLYPVDNIDEAYAALFADTVVAVVYDAPILLYYAGGEGKGRVSVVGKKFAPQDYAIALTQGSKWREKINLGVLVLEESGEARRIRTKWFGHGNSL